MDAFTVHEGVSAPILVDNVDTDQIIPSREMKRVSKQGLGDSLFAGWRYVYDGMEKAGLNDEFILNKSRYASASILLSGKNFGCGSSREHAVWALHDYGIKAVIAESFGRIFRINCAKNGLLPIELTAEEVEILVKQSGRDPQSQRIQVDLQDCSVRAPDGDVFKFSIDESDRQMLLLGLDFIDFTLQFADDIGDFKNRDRLQRPWAHLPGD